MHGDLHFEVVLDRAGHYRVYFTDAHRRELPATVASEVTVTITRKGHRPEALRLHVDSSAGAWTTTGEAVDDPDAMVRIAYVVAGTPYFIDLPLAAAAAAGQAPGASHEAGL